MLHSIPLLLVITAPVPNMAGTPKSVIHDKAMVAHARLEAKKMRVIRKRPANGSGVGVDGVGGEGGEGAGADLTNAEKFVKGLVEIETPPFLPPCDPQQKGDQLVRATA